MLRTKIDGWLRLLEHGYDTYNRIEVSKAALLANLKLFQTEGQQVIPVLKGNAYGHGIEIVANALKDTNVPYIAVDGYFEALRVRSVCKSPVLVMGMIKPGNYKDLRYNSFTFVIQDLASLQALGAVNKPCKMHLEINSGMQRNGIAADQLALYLQEIKKYPHLQLDGVMSHLADSDGDSAATITEPTKIFDDCVVQILSAGFSPKIIHLAQTAGSVRATSAYANTIRLGIGLYGINPFEVNHPSFNTFANLQPALKLISTVSRVNDVKKGEGISYNYTYTAPRDMRVGVLPLGYYEGVPRVLSNRGVVKIGSQYLPIVGRVCMNHTLVALEPSVKVGDEVVVFSNNPGDKNSVLAFRNEFNLFDYDVVSKMSTDLRRVLV